MNTQDIRGMLIDAAVRSLNEFGYPMVTADNILTDDIFKALFLPMLEDNKGTSGVGVDRAIAELIDECVKEAK